VSQRDKKEKNNDEGYANTAPLEMAVVIVG
jgi:hypothetical protein